jgi:hypothetical protein
VVNLLKLGSAWLSARGGLADFSGEGGEGSRCLIEACCAALMFTSQESAYLVVRSCRPHATRSDRICESMVER